MADPLISSAIRAAREAGALLKENFGTPLKVNEMQDHDIKLELDVQSQDLIAKILLTAHPDHAFFGEEGIEGAQDSAYQWIVDPIDGTVNYFYSIPHFCISIALRHQGKIVLGVIYDPLLDELYQVEKGKGAQLNGKPIHVSDRNLKNAVITIGFSKDKASIDAGLERYKQIAYSVRKTRVFGSAALALAYIACGRLDAYIEEQISIWDIAAGWLLIEEAGGLVEVRDSPVKQGKQAIIASNNTIDLSAVPRN
ncbi:MAG: myo-inositol-1(or 4)-monophosphatase [Verrucomicrobiales bacterium]|jgi:myo-inositol-1(or 4)-monophosphatase